MIYTLTQVGFMSRLNTEKISDTRCIGYFFDLTKINEIIKKGMYGLNEAGYYPYLIVEHVPEGVYPFNTKVVAWYKYKNNKWSKLKKAPKIANPSSICYGIG